MNKILLLLCWLCPMCSIAQTGNELTYPQTQFDSDTCCWRKLSKSRQYEGAGLLIVAYLNTEHAQNKHALKWHAGQLFASAENKRMALKYIHKTYNVFYKWFGGEDGKAWYYYAKGTAAFIKRDKHHLENIIRRWDRKLPKDRNYNQLQLLSQNWSKGYAEALK